MTLKRLSLSVLRPGEAAAAATQPGVAPAGPAAFTRQNVRLVLATRLQVSKLSAVEAVLLGAAMPHGTEPPSVLRGSVVRFVSKGRYQLDRVASTQLDENGELVLTLQDFERPIPLICISSTSSLDDDRLFQKHGRAELAALAAGVARSGSAPTLRELAATCHRLCLGWLWSDQLEVLRSAVHKDAAAVAALLEPPAAVAALLPCFEDSVGAAAASKASPTSQAGLPPLPAEGAKLHATGADQPQAGTRPAVSAAGHDASASAETGPSKGSEQQQQQQHRRQQDAGASPSAAKKQRTDSNAKGSTPAAPPLEPGELPPAEEEQKQRQQRQQRAQQVGLAVQRQSQKPQTVPPPPPPAGAAAGGGGGGGGAAAGAAAAGMEAGAQGSSRKHRFEQQEALPSHIMPPGGKLESLLLEAVGLVDMQFGGQLRQVGDLGNKLATLDKGWKQQVPSSCGLAKLVMELNRRGLVQAQARDGNVYVRKLPARAPPPQLNPLPPTLPPAFAPYFAPTSNILPQNVRFTF